MPLLTYYIEYFVNIQLTGWHILRHKCVKDANKVLPRAFI